MDKPNYNLIIRDFLQSTTKPELWIAIIAIFKTDENFVKNANTIAQYNFSFSNLETLCGISDAYKYGIKYRYIIRDYINSDMSLIDKLGDIADDINEVDGMQLGEFAIKECCTKFIEWTGHKMIYASLYL